MNWKLVGASALGAILALIAAHHLRSDWWVDSEYNYSIELLKDLGYDCSPRMRVTEFVICVLENAKNERKSQ